MKVGELLCTTVSNYEFGEQWWPDRGLGPMPPTDPVIYRLYEVCTDPVHCFPAKLTARQGCVGVRACNQGKVDHLDLLTSGFILSLRQAIIHEKASTL